MEKKEISSAPLNKLYYNLFFIVCLFTHFPLFSKDSFSKYEEAYRVEKISPIFSIVLYEEALKNAKNRKLINTILTRLSDLYLRYNRYEDIFILNKNYPQDRSRKKKTDRLVHRITTSIGSDQETFEKCISLSLENTPESHAELLQLYKNSSNAYLMKFIIPLKLKTGDLAAIEYFIQEVPDLNPSIKLMYMIKSENPDTEEFMKKVSSDEELNDKQKFDILYLYGIYLQKKKKYKQSVRYFRMSLSYTEKEDGTTELSQVEMAKSLILANRTTEGCAAAPEKFEPQTESEQLIWIYCNKSKDKTNLNVLVPAFTILSEKENGQIYKKVLELLGK